MTERILKSSFYIVNGEIQSRKIQNYIPVLLHHFEFSYIGFPECKRAWNFKPRVNKIIAFCPRIYTYVYRQYVYIEAGDMCVCV